MKIRNVLLAGILVFVMLFSMTACGGTKDQTNDTTQAQSQQQAGTETVDGSTAGEAFSYPVKTDVTLKWWLRQTNSKLSSTNDYPWAKELIKQTGINVEFINPTFGKETEAFNILLASGDYPDIISYHWGQSNIYPGGATKALDDGIALGLNDVMEKWAPNLTKVLKENPDWDKQAKTDDGKYWMFPFIRGDDVLMTFQGPIVREDWLKDLNMELPETIDDWHVMLTAFKEKKGAAAPLTYMENANLLEGDHCFVGAYGIARNFYQENGVVKYGPIDPRYKDFLTTFRQWYAEGLLDRDFATVDNPTVTADITSGKSGATIHNAGGGIGTYLNTMKDKAASYSVTGAPYPVLNKGDKPLFGQKDLAIPGTDVSVVCATSKNIEMAVRLLDYGYTEAGHMLMNFGVDGKSYNLVDNYPKYSEEVTKNPEGLSFSEALGSYCNGTCNPVVQDARYIEQFLTWPQQIAAVPRWANTDTEKYQLPAAITQKGDESDELAKIMADINTYQREMFLKFVVGSESLDNYDNYVKTIEKMNIARAIELKQAALDRYGKR